MYYTNQNLMKAKRVRKSVMYLTLAQKKDIIRDINIEALFVLDYYLSRSNIPNYDFDDSRVANAINFTTAKVAKLRRLLEANGYFKKEVFYDRSGKAQSTVFTLCEAIKGE